jgi:hypothetical protein
MRPLKILLLHLQLQLFGKSAIANRCVSAAKRIVRVKIRVKSHS